MLPHTYAEDMGAIVAAAVQEGVSRAFQHAPALMRRHSPEERSWDVSLVAALAVTALVLLLSIALAISSLTRSVSRATDMMMMMMAMRAASMPMQMPMQYGQPMYYAAPGR